MIAFMMKWGVLITLVLVMTKTDIGRRIVIYFLWLTVLLVLLSNAKDFADILKG